MYELEYLMEKAFSEGYEYAQKEFGTKSKIGAILSPGGGLECERVGKVNC